MSRSAHDFLFLLLFVLTLSPVLGQLAPIALDVTGVAQHHTTQRSRLHRRDTNHAIPVVFNEQTYVYTVNVTIGTPPQPYVLLLNPNYADTVVVGKSATASLTRTYTSGIYNANASSSYTYLSSSLDLFYGNGSQAKGDFVSDTMTIGGTSVAGVRLGIVYNGSLPDNYIGLGYQVTSNAHPGLLASLYKSGALTCQAYSLWLNGINGPTGQLLLGGIDTGKFEGTLETVYVQTSDLTNNNDITVTLDSLSYTAANNQHINTGALSVTFDAWTTLIYLPENATSPLFARLDLTYSQSLQLATGICDNIDNSTNLDFLFGSRTITINVSDLVHYYETISGTHYCYINIVPAAQSPYSFGIAFLQSLYLVFDLTHNQISLAPIVNSNSTSNITIIPSGGVAGFASTANVGGSGNNNVTSGNNSTTTIHPSEGGLSTGAKAGIGVGVALGAISLISMVGLFLLRRRKQGHSTTGTGPAYNPLREEGQGGWAKPELAANEDRRRQELEAIEQEKRHAGRGSIERYQMQELLGDYPQHELESATPSRTTRTTPQYTSSGSGTYDTNATQSTSTGSGTWNTNAALSGHSSPTNAAFPRSPRSPVPRRKPVPGSPPFRYDT